MIMPIIIIAIAVCIAIFENVDKESVKKAVDVKPTFQLPKLNDDPMAYIIDGEPYEIETPNSKYNKTANKLPVMFNGITGEIFIPASLEFQIAVAMQKLDINPTPKNFGKIIGMELRVWMNLDESTGNSYYNAQITPVNDSEIKE